jgi:hypothetical protein
MLKMMGAVLGTAEGRARHEGPARPLVAGASQELRAMAARLAALAEAAEADGAAAGYGSPAAVGAMIGARRRRAALFGDTLFAEPGWDMMLALFAAHIEGKALEPAALYEASAVAPTAALRWLDLLVEAGLILRVPDPHDRRRLRIALTESAAERMRRFVVDAAGPGGA